MQMAFVSNGGARLDPTINLPQMFDLPDQKLAATISKHNDEKEYPAFDFWAPITRHLPDHAMRGWPRAQNRPDAVPGCSALQGDFAHPTELAPRNPTYRAAPGDCGSSPKSIG